MLIVENILNVNCSKYFCLKCTKDCGDKKVKKIKKHSPGMPAAKLEKKLSRSSIK